MYFNLQKENLNSIKNPLFQSVLKLGYLDENEVVVFTLSSGSEEVPCTSHTVKLVVTTIYALYQWVWKYYPHP